MEFDAKAANKIADEKGEISKEDFFQFAIDTKLLEFGSVMGDGSIWKSMFKKPTTPTEETKQSHQMKSSSGKVYIQR